jgi:protein-S-isoprenylcysteine O-methyltransferase Ste14
MFTAKLIPILVKKRVVISRIFGVALLLLIMFTTHSFSDTGTTVFIFEMVGLFLLSICSLGRIWALLYVSGYKSNTLITQGPYSIARHPLYFFSLIGSLGIGFASENILVLALIIIFYFIYYPITIIAEEKKLMTKFGQEWVEYTKKTPRFIPNFKLHQEPEFYMVKTANFARNVFQGMWFIWLFILLHFVGKLHESGAVPILFRVP